MQNVNIVNVSKALLETLNATQNASENASLPNTCLLYTSDAADE